MADFFSHRFTSHMAQREVYDHLTANVVPYFAVHGYKVESATPEKITLAAYERQTWVILVCIFLFPIGLLALLAAKIRHEVQIALRPDERGTDVFFIGDAPPMLRNAILALTEGG